MPCPIPVPISEVSETCCIVKSSIFAKRNMRYKPLPSGDLDPSSVREDLCTKEKKGKRKSQVPEDEEQWNNGHGIFMRISFVVVPVPFCIPEPCSLPLAIKDDIHVEKSFRLRSLREYRIWILGESSCSFLRIARKKSGGRGRLCPCMIHRRISGLPSPSSSREKVQPKFPSWGMWVTVREG